MADIDFTVPLYLKLPGMAENAPVAAECPVCFAVVLTSRLGDHERASHG